MTEKIFAIKREKYGTYTGDQLPMCSASEIEDTFVVDESTYDYILPKGFHKFQTQSTNSIPIVCVDNSREIVLGHAAKAFYVVGGSTYNSMEECMNDPLFHPSDYVICNSDNVDRVVEYQNELIENECYGD